MEKRKQRGENKEQVVMPQAEALVHLASDKEIVQRAVAQLTYRVSN